MTQKNIFKVLFPLISSLAFLLGSCNLNQEEVVAPVFSPGTGTYTSTQTVTITTTTEGAFIRYTTDGSVPTETSGILYTQPVFLYSTALITAIAYKEDWLISSAASARFTIDPVPVVLSSGNPETVSQLNDKSMYVLLSPQAADKQEAYGTPLTTYNFTLSSTRLASLQLLSSSLASPGLSARPAGFPRAQGVLDQFLRSTDDRLLTSGTKQLSKGSPGFYPAAPSPIVPGSTWNDININAGAESFLTINATCRYISTYACFFIDNRDTVQMEPYLAAYGTAFDAIYLVNHEKFGIENDTDGNGKVIIVFTRELIEPGYLGYFWSGDKYPKSIIEESNEGDIFYITTESDYQGAVIYGTLAHEFQHMIFFDQHYNRGTEPDLRTSSVWLNEALSQAAEYYNNYPDNHLEWIIQGYLLNTNRSALSLTHWTPYNYGYGAVFIRYLIDRFGDTAIKNMCSTGLGGIAAVEAATGQDFNTIFGDFSFALVMSGTGASSDPRYNFATLDLQAIQPQGQCPMVPAWNHRAGNTTGFTLYPYAILFSSCTGVFDTITLSGIEATGTVFGL